MKVIAPIVVGLTISMYASSDADYEPVEVAGNHHQVKFENEKVRVLEVVIEPGDTVPLHQHTMESIFITLQPASLVFRDSDGLMVKEVERSDYSSIPDYEARGAAPAPRSVENVDSITMKAIRIELK
jgi:hypothetical protein